MIKFVEISCMKAIEFKTKLKDSPSIDIPEKYRSMIRNKKLRVLILINEDVKDDKLWKRLSSEEFLKGYSDKDAIYDNE